MPAPYSLRSPNGREILYFVAQDVTGPVIAKRALSGPNPGNAELLLAVNALSREEKVTMIAVFAEVTLAGDQTGIVGDFGGLGVAQPSQAAAEAATPTGSGLQQLQALLHAARNWDQQAGGRTRGASAYPTASGSTGTGETTLIMGTWEDGTNLEVQGFLEGVAPTWSPKKNDQGAKVFHATLTFRVGTVMGA